MSRTWTATCDECKKEAADDKVITQTVLSAHSGIACPLDWFTQKDFCSVECFWVAVDRWIAEEKKP